MTSPSQADGLVKVGDIVGLFGVKGWLKIHSYTRPREAIFAYDRWMLGQDGKWSSVVPRQGKAQGKGLIVALEGISDRDQAATLLGTEIAIEREQLPTLPKGEFYWQDLEGMQVENQEGQLLGVVKHLFETGANDVMVVQGEKEYLIPYIDSVVLEVNTDAGLIRVDWDQEF
ncbi:MAG: ribosome maturation factor RimM [Gammaproteobacteria bacterium]|nr:MAG: ribosome maturation factor RimM [Gammaproteobacteria bacterium]